MKRLAMAALMLPLLLGACGSSGPVRRVSEPSANIQQLSVRADGSWSVDLRIDNFSSVPMRFDGISLAMTIAGEQAGTLQGRPALAIGPETAPWPWPPRQARRSRSPMPWRAAAASITTCRAASSPCPRTAAHAPTRSSATTR